MLAGCTTDVPVPAPVTSSPPTPSALRQPPPSGLAGVTATGGLGIKALLSTLPPTLFDSDQGPAGTTVGYPGGDDRLYSVFRVGPTPVFLAYRPCRSNGADCEIAEVLVHTGPTTPPSSLGKASSFAAGADGQSLWLIRRDAPDRCRLQHVKLTGVEIGHSQPAACNTGVRAETKHGLLITINAGAAEHTDVLIDPGTGRTIQQQPEILAVFGDFMLLNGVAELTLVDLRDGSRKQLRGPSAGHYPAMVASRDGTMLAVDFADPAWHSTNIQVRDIWILNLNTIEWQHAPGMPYTTENLNSGGLSWNESGDLVLLDDVFAAWHPGEPTWRLAKAKVVSKQEVGYVLLD